MTLNFVPDFVYGSTDGLISTLNIIASSTAAGVSPSTTIALAMANVIADGYSMAVSAYQSHMAQPEDTHESSIKSGVVTFFAFFVAGTMLVVPFFLFKSVPLTISFSIALCGFFTLGILRESARTKNQALTGDLIAAGAMSLAIGASAALIAYSIGSLIK
jgi:VIT1/CCC1 family predicted Fe2+/Mn2+ transporter